MPKYKVNIGGFVSTFRERTFTVSADNEVEAINKAEDKFIKVQQSNGYSMCGGGTVNWIDEIV